MMDRGVMQRQMFAKGGAAFPDMNNDGTITQADILMGRGVQFKQEGGAIDSQPSFDARDPANKARFLQQNPEMSSSDYNQIFGIEEAPSDIFDPNDPANKARFLIENEGMTSEDYDKIFGVSNMAEGGIAGMMPPEMTAAPAMAGAMAAQSDMPSEAVNQAAGAMDPAVLEQMLGTVDENIQNLDGAEDFETVMNSMRGDDATLEERYMELADVVGEEDAAQTPESVLALVQPVMMLNAVDQGIGGLAQEEMTAPVEGAMAEGIMSTVAPPPEPAMMAAPPTAPGPAGMGGPPPVNFKDGGLVRRGDNQPVQMFDNGGGVQQYFGPRIGITPEQSLLLRERIDAQNPVPVPSYDQRVLDAAKGAEARYAAAGLGTAEERAADLEEQRNMTQAQMLFDIAQTALTFAGPMQGERAGMSPAERLAMAATQTKLPQTIGARAQAQLEAKKAAGKEERALKLAAVQRGEAQVDAEIAAEEALKLKRIGAKPTEVKGTKPFVTTQQIVIDDITYPADTLVNLRPNQVAQVTPDSLSPYKAETGEAGAKKAYTVTNPITYKGNSLVRGDTLVVSSKDAEGIDNFGVSVVPFKAPENPKDVNILFPDDSVQTLTPGTKAYTNAIKPEDDGGRGGVLTGAATIDSALAAKPIEVRDANGEIVDRLDLSKPEDRKTFAGLGNDVTTHTIGTYSPDAKSSVWKEIRSSDGTLVDIVDTNTEAGAQAVKDAPSKDQGAFNIGTYSATTEKLGTKLVVNTKPVTVNGEVVAAGTPMYLTDKEVNEVKTNEGAGSLRNYEKADKPPNIFGSGDAGKALNYFSIAQNADGIKAIDAYAAGAEDPIMESQIAIYTAAVPDARGLISRRPLPDFVKAAIKKRLLANPALVSPVPLNTLGLTTEEMQTIRPTQDIPLLNADNTVNIERATADPTFIITGLDYTKSQGFGSTLTRVFNGFMGQAAELGIGPGYAGNTGKLTGAADKQLKALGRKTIDVGRAGRDGRVFALDLELLKQEVEGFYPGGARTDNSALQQLRVVRSTLASNYARAKFIVDENNKSPGSYDKGRVGDAKIAMRDTEQLIAEYTAAILAYEANIQGRGSSTTVTGGLPRVK